MNKFLGQQYIHKLEIEDFWANCHDDLDVIKRTYSSVIVEYIKALYLFFPNQILEDDKVLQDKEYNKVVDNPIPLPNWTEEQVKNLNIVIRLVLRITKRWVEAQKISVMDQIVKVKFEEIEQGKDSSNEEEEHVEEEVRQGKYSTREEAWTYYKAKDKAKKTKEEESQPTAKPKVYKRKAEFVEGAKPQAKGAKREKKVATKQADRKKLGYKVKLIYV